MIVKEVKDTLDKNLKNKIRSFVTVIRPPWLIKAKICITNIPWEIFMEKISTYMLHSKPSE